MAQKRNMPSRNQILKFWSKSNVFEEKGIEINETHPDCFACGNYIKIERAHIRAKFNGGEDQCDNLHLLCASCHAESEYYEGDQYWTWLIHTNANKFVDRFERLYEKSQINPSYWLSALQLLKDNEELMKKYANFVTKENIDSEIMRYEKIVAQSDGGHDSMTNLTELEQNADREARHGHRELVEKTMSDEDTIRLDPEESYINIGPIQEPISIIPPKVRAEACLNGDWSVVFRFTVPAPNRFHRLMQRLLLGIHWREVEDDQ